MAMHGFLRLFIECDTWASTTGKSASPLKSMAQVISDRLLKYLQSLVDIAPNKIGEYNNTSWAIAQLHSYYLFVDDKNNLSITSAMAKPHIQYADFSFALDKSSKQFFSLFGNWIYCIGIVHRKEGIETAVKNHPIYDEHLEATQDLLSVHHLGINWSRAWALKLLAKTAPSNQARDRYYNAFLKHIQVGINYHNKIQETQIWGTYSSYFAYDHWVPQFIVYALTDYKHDIFN